MSKTIRQKISHAIQTTFRLSPKSKQSKIISCCSAKKPNDYEYVSYEQKQISAKNDYIDLSECHSWSLSYSKDSGISRSYQLESTKIFPDDSSSLSTLSNLSSIRHDPENVQHITWNSSPTSFQCCHCHCHHHVNNELWLNEKTNVLHPSEQFRQKLTRKKVYPFIF